MTTRAEGVGVGEGLGVGVGVLVGVGPGVGVGVGEGVGLGVGDGSGVGVGAAVQETVAEPVLRGAGAAVWKSLGLSFASAQPSSLLKAERVLLGAGAGPPPSKQLADGP